MKQYLKVIKNYLNFKGRASRREFWTFFLISILIMRVLLYFDLFFNDYALLTKVYILYSLLPTISVVVRRLHDSGENGSTALIGLIPIVGIVWLLIILARKSEYGDNKYGISLSINNHEYEKLIRDLECGSYLHDLKGRHLIEILKRDNIAACVFNSKSIRAKDIQLKIDKENWVKISVEMPILLTLLTFVPAMIAGVLYVNINHESPKTYLLCLFILIPYSISLLIYRMIIAPKRKQEIEDISKALGKYNIKILN